MTVAQLFPPYEARTASECAAPSPLVLADGRPGHYRVQVEAAGYRSWERVAVVREREVSGGQ